MPSVEISNWEGAIKSHPAVVVRATNVDEIVDIVRDTEKYPSPVSPENVIRSIPAWRGVACQRSDLAQSVRNLPTPRGGRRFTQPGAQDSGGRERLKSARSAQAARR